MANKNKPSGDYEVGYGKPPKSGQIKKGERRNPKGRPTERNREQVDVAATLNEPLVVKNSGIRQKMPPFEVGVRRLVERALKQKNLPAILEFLDLCETYGLMVPPPIEYGAGVLQLPKGVNSIEEWLESDPESLFALLPDAEDDDID